MSDKKITIGIETTADTSGAKKAEQAITEIGSETKRTEREINSLEKQSQKLGQELARTGNTSEGVSTKMRGRLTGSIQQAGFQIQDFAVQVGAGTSAMTAFGQQAPQFLGAFGPAGSIAGAIVAIGAVAYNVFSKMGSDAGNTKKALEDMNGAIEQIAKNKVADLADEFAESAQAADLATRRTLALKEGIDEVVKARKRLALSLLDAKAQDRETATAEANAKRLKEGKPIDSQRVANDALQRTLERQSELARQATADEDGKVKAAQETAILKAAELKAAEAAQEKAQRQLDLDRERLTVIRETEESLKRQAKEKTADPESGALFTTPAAIAAQKKLLDPAFAAEKDAVQGTIAANETRLAGPGSELNKAVANAEIEYLAARTRVTNQVAAAGINTEAITSDAGITRTNTVAGAVENSKTAVVGQLEGLVSGIGESGGKDLAPFITEMKSILQDKALSADELARLPALLAQYFGKIANLGSAQNSAVREAMERVDGLEREVRNLKITANQRNP